MLNKSEIAKIRKRISAEGEGAAEIFDVLGKKNRFRMFKLFLARHDLCVTDIANILKISVPAASQHLKVLEMTGIIECDKQGQSCCYKIRKDNKILRSIIRIIK